MTLSYLDMMEQAAIIASRAHSGQKRMDGTPYISHPIRVMARVGEYMQDIRPQIVAILHDVIEDTDVSLQDLSERGFSNEILTALDAVTKRKGEKYNEFVERIIKAGELAVVVKLADIADNLSDQSTLDPDDAEYFTRKYVPARERLQEALSGLRGENL